jgi:hypothetical protein
LALAPEPWIVVSNTPGELLDEVTAKKAQDSFSVSKQMLE